MKLFCFLGPGKWETLSFRSRSPRPGWMEGPDSRGRCPSLVSRVQGFLQKGRPRASRRNALTSRPGLRSTGCCDPRVRLARSPSDALGSSWRLLSFPQRLASLLSSPSRPGQSAPLPLALACASANKNTRHGPPPPGGRGKAGRGQSPTSVDAPGGLGGGPRGPEQGAGEEAARESSANQMGARSPLLTGGRDFTVQGEFSLYPLPHITVLRSWELLMNGAEPTPTSVLRIWSLEPDNPGP